MSRHIAPYPWSALDRLTRRSLRAAQQARCRFKELDFSGICASAGELLGCEVELIAQDEYVGPMPGLGVELGFDAAGPVTLGCDPELAAEVTARLLQRQAPLAAPGQPVDASLVGALAALLVEATRRSGSRLAFTTAAPSNVATEGLVFRGTLLVAGRAYATAAWLPLELQAAASGNPSVSLPQLGELPIAVPVVAALAQIERAELRALRVGDALLPGDGWLWQGMDEGAAALAAPGSESGVSIEFSGAGAPTIVLRGETLRLSVEADEPMSDENLHQAVLEAPVVIRVEVGSVSLTAREWGELRPGDVIETGQRIAEPVVLRVGGRALARGELVEVDGELGVRILELDQGRDE